MPRGGAQWALFRPLRCHGLPRLFLHSSVAQRQSIRLFGQIGRDEERGDFGRDGKRSIPRLLGTSATRAILEQETPRGPAWHRYQSDGYGEHADGGAFDGTGIGRAWPLLTGERAHDELAAGRTHVAERLAQAMEAFAGGSVLLPEQIWDGHDIPDRALFIGNPSGSAMPLVWAHAEYVKLCRPSETARSSIGRLKRFNDTW